MRRWCITLILASICFLAGCNRNEIENRAFPLAMGIEADADWKGTYRMYAAYPDLMVENAVENALSTDVFRDADMADLVSGVALMSRESNRNVDMNHLKVMILDCNMLDGGEHAEELISFFQGRKNAAWNTYVMVTDGKLPEIFVKEDGVNTCLGIYLEDLMEGWENLRSGGLITVGDLVSQYYNRRETFLIPMLTVEEGSPAVHAFARVENLKYRSQVSMEAVFEQTDTLKQLKTE